MSVQQIHESLLTHREWTEYCQRIEQESSFSGLIWTVLQAGLWISRMIAQSELNRRADIPTEWPSCVGCGQKLQSKRFREQ